MIKYFIACRVTTKDGVKGTARVGFDIDRPITSMEVIEAAEQKIRQTFDYESVCITNWQRFEEDAEDDR